MMSEKDCFYKVFYRILKDKYKRFYWFREIFYKLNWIIKFLRYFVCLGEILYIVLIVLCKCIIFSILICKKIWIKDKRKYSDKLRILNDVKKYIEI